MSATTARPLDSSIAKAAMPENPDKHFWDQIAAKYSRGTISDMAGYERTLERMRDLLGSGDNVLELGCGTGTTALRLAPLASSYLATDISPAMIAIANDKLEASPVPNLRFAALTAHSASRPENGFDAVLGFNYLHLVEDVPATLAAIRGLLRPGGLFVTKTPCIGELNPLIRMAIPLMRLVGKAPRNIQSLDEASLLDALRRAGFSIEAVERHGSRGKDPRPFVVARMA